MATLGETIRLPGVPPTDKDGPSAEYLRQLQTTLTDIRAAIIQLESIQNTKRI